MKYFFGLLVIVGSVFLGAAGMWAYLHSSGPELRYDEKDLQELLSHTTTQIPAASFACEIAGKSVGAVIAARGFFELNSDRVSRTSFGCDDEDCSLDVSGCEPWQSSECGQTILRYKIDGRRKIVASSFTCLDIP